MLDPGQDGGGERGRRWFPPGRLGGRQVGRFVAVVQVLEGERLLPARDVRGGRQELADLDRGIVLADPLVRRPSWRSSFEKALRSRSVSCCYVRIGANGLRSS